MDGMNFHNLSPMEYRYLREKYPNALIPPPGPDNYDDGFTDGSPYEGTHEVWVSDGQGGLKKIDKPNNSFD